MSIEKLEIEAAEIKTFLDYLEKEKERNMARIKNNYLKDTLYFINEYVKVQNELYAQKILRLCRTGK